MNDFLNILDTAYAEMMDGVNAVANRQKIIDNVFALALKRYNERKEAETKKEQQKAEAVQQKPAIKFEQKK